MDKKTWESMNLRLSNRILSALLALLGYASRRDNNEVDVIVPMYGMPSSVYRKKSKAGEIVIKPSALPFSSYEINPTSHAV